MVTSIILIHVDRHKINEVAEQLASMDQISEAFSVSGNYDIVAIVRVKNNDALAEFVTKDLVKIEGIENTDTMLAFKAYSKYDLEAMFDI